MNVATLQQKNKRVLTTALTVAVCMVGLCFAALPLYRRFCAVTGFNGTTRTAGALAEKAAARHVGNRIFTVRFDTNVAPGMPWRFTPEMAPVQVKVGADELVSFFAENLSDKPVTGVAVYNVTPLKVGRYFFKTQCFCFGEQTLTPHQSVHMPVSFYIDPSIVNDPNMADVHTITLSYTFFHKDSEGLEKAVKKFYTDDVPPGQPPAGGNAAGQANKS